MAGADDVPQRKLTEFFFRGAGASPRASSSSDARPQAESAARSTASLKRSWSREDDLTNSMIEAIIDEAESMDYETEQETSREAEAAEAMRQDAARRDRWANGRLQQPSAIMRAENAVHSSLSYVDAWDDAHVRLACSPNNCYKEGGVLKSKWALIVQALTRPLRSPGDLREAILTYNQTYADRWDFEGLARVFEDHPSVSSYFFRETCPKLAALCLRLPELIKDPIPLLRPGTAASLTLSQLQIACLLANAFFCTYPRRNGSRPGSSMNLPSINFNSLYVEGSSPAGPSKLLSLLHYFRRVTDEPPTGRVTFTRQVLDVAPAWECAQAELGALDVRPPGQSIEDGGAGMLQVDFANKLIGGGVLGWGAVQEEIRFCICPELIASRLFTAQLAENEAVLIVGAERYSNYTGYGHLFAWHSDHRDPTPRDVYGRVATEIVAIDALPFNRPSAQYAQDILRRELNKAFVGFAAGEARPAPLATGHWGCGAFGGDRELKALIQLMAASLARRDTVFFPFDEGTDFPLALMRAHAALRDRRFTVSQLYRAICQYFATCRPSSRQSSDAATVGLFEFLEVHLAQ